MQLKPIHLWRHHSMVGNADHDRFESRAMQYRMMLKRSAAMAMAIGELQQLA